MERLIAEPDFINLLLHNHEIATPDQIKILRHPRRDNQSTVVRIKGAAGSGKTLCLLAKLLQEAMQIPEGAPAAPENSLMFVCFNREMAHYAARLLKPFPEAKRIKVTTFDSLVYQLLMPTLDNEAKPPCSDAAFPAREHWKIDYSTDFTAEAMRAVGQRRRRYFGTYLLNTTGQQGPKNISWMNDELCWLEAHYQTEAEAQRFYPAAPRTGRGSTHLPDQNARQVILEIWHEQRQLLRAAKRFTLEQAVNRLMKSKELPRFAMIAVDEAQDLATRSIQLLLKMREHETSRVYLAVDEDQRIYQRDFSWKQLGVARRATTYKLTENLRNGYEVEAFALRCQGIVGDAVPIGTHVQLLPGGEEKVLELAATLAAQSDSTTLLVGGPEWDAKLTERGVPVRNLVKKSNDAEKQSRQEINIALPGLYVMGELKCKGLEFDNVLIPSLECGTDDPDDALRRRYVHFTRARDNLYVVIGSRIPSWAQKAFHDLL
ncbi:UvrD-helicase domain-containing protein [Adlercreutzia mucosicola]|uniref:UvrD-helicase domain-containing protein n=1 Tax=Adlercreutzia mucosicola TaxID=580026 RepID=UPI00041DFACE|nr:UvrD-helicase domain-containing protein [Adlercreutzia mucosicola]MCR2035074.1 ATP-dependent helicase [Adlercreutzia mucosicola]